jgi:hypothetical protein
MSARAVRLYREVYFDLKIRHFHEKPRDHYEIDLSYTRVQQALQGAGLVAKRKKHYLKPYGCGMFGILCCRRGTANGALHAIREQWIGGSKLIVVLSDETLLDMIQRKSSGLIPEELLRHQIARFRKSL